MSDEIKPTENPLEEPIGSRDYLQVMAVLSQSPKISAELLNNFSKLISSVPSKEATHRRWIPIMQRPEKRPVRISGIDFSVTKLLMRQFMQLSPKWLGYVQYCFHDWESVLGQNLDFFMLARVIFERALWDGQNGSLTYFSENVLLDFWGQLECDSASQEQLSELHLLYVEKCRTERDEAEKSGQPLPEFLPFGVCFLLDSLAEETLGAFSTWLGLNTFFMSSIAANAGGNTAKGLSTLAGLSTSLIGQIGQSMNAKSFSKSLGFQNLVPQPVSGGG